MSRILIAVLNWGMGHASRTLPIIEGALDIGWEVDVASSGDAMIWLKGRLSENDLKKRMSLIKGATSLESISNADIVIEAVFEEMNLKKDMFQRIDKIAKKDCILATNTSSISITKIGSVTSKPENVILLW